MSRGVFCLSLFKTTKICFGSTKMKIFYRDKSSSCQGKKSGKTTLPPQKNFPVTPLTVKKGHCQGHCYAPGSDPFSKTWTRGHWPLDDLWPHICWGHMCDFTQGSLCPSPMGIHQCMWIQLSILQNFNQDYHIPLTTYYILPWYYVHTTYRIKWSHSLFLNKVQAKQ